MTEQATVLLAEWRMFRVAQLDQPDERHDRFQPRQDVEILRQVIGIEDDAQVRVADGGDHLQAMRYRVEDRPLIAAADVHRLQCQVDADRLCCFGENLECLTHDAMSVIDRMSAAASGNHHHGSGTDVSCQLNRIQAIENALAVRNTTVGLLLRW